MRFIKTAIVFCAIASLTVGISYGKEAKKDDALKIMISEGTQNNQTMEHLDILTNRFGGRLLGSDAYENAMDWAESKFKEWGLVVMKEEVGSLPVGFNRGPWFGRMLDTDGMILHFATPSYTSGTKGVQRGHVLMEPRTESEFNTMKGALKGAWVLISGKSNGFPIDISAAADAHRDSIIMENAQIAKENDEISRWNRANPNAKKELKELKTAPALFYRQMREAGILGIIQSASVPIQALYDRKNINNMTFNTLPTVPDIKLEAAQYDIIAQKVKERRYFQLEFDIRNHFKMGPVKYYNLIGVIKGSKYPDEYTLCGGHFDAYDVATGGVDCGTGVAPTMEAARLIAKAMKESGDKPLRSMMFCLWAGEEFGLLGSKYFVEKHKDMWPKIMNYFNRDGGPTVANGLTVPPAWYESMDKVCAPLYHLNPDFPFVLKQREGAPRPRPKVAAGTDSGPFAVAGIPTLGFATGDPLGYNFSYGEIWHTERDTYDKSIPVYMNHTSIVNAVVLWGMSNLPQMLPAGQ